MDTAEILDLNAKHVFPATINYFEESLPLVRGQGTALWDAEGKEYLDFFGGILTVSVGHSNERVTRRIHEQVDTLVHASTLYPTPPMVLLAKKLADIAPGDLSQTFFTASGTEADETAVMLAKLATGQQEVIVNRHSYSGRSHLNTSMTSHASWRPLPTQVPGVKHAPAPYCYRCPFNLTYPSCGVACAEDLEELIQTSTNGHPAAYVAEPIMGVGGIITPPKEYLDVAVSIVRRHGGLFVSDEVQTFARTGGTWWGCEQYGVEPDILTTAKGLANGLPVGVTVTRPELAAAWKGLTISTFGGNPVSCAAATATLEEMETEDLLENAAVVGARLRSGLEALQEKHPVIGDVRGMGLMQGVELVEDRESKAPAKRAVNALLEAARAQGILIGKGGLYGNVIRISPPLNVAEEEVDRGLRLLDDAFAAIAHTV